MKYNSNASLLVSDKKIIVNNCIFKNLTKKTTFAKVIGYLFFEIFLNFSTNIIVKNTHHSKMALV